MGGPGDPRIGRDSIARARSSAAEELTAAPGAKLLGSIDLNKTRTFEEDGPPPWESDPRYFKHNTDARRFVDVPETWELRWLAPKQVERDGFRDWQTVPAQGDDRITVKNRSMIAADNTIRRGGHGGDFLAYMPKTWVASRWRIKSEKARRAAMSSRERVEQFKEQMAKGNFGPHQKVTEASVPTAAGTLADGRTLDRT